MHNAASAAKRRARYDRFVFLTTNDDDDKMLGVRAWRLLPDGSLKVPSLAPVPLRQVLKPGLGFIVVTNFSDPLANKVEQLIVACREVHCAIGIVRRLPPENQAVPKFADVPANIVADIKDESWAVSLPRLAEGLYISGVVGPHPRIASPSDCFRPVLFVGDPRMHAFEAALASEPEVATYEVMTWDSSVKDSRVSGEDKRSCGVSFVPLSAPPSTSSLHLLETRELPFDRRRYLAEVEPADTAESQAKAIVALHLSHEDWRFTHSLMDRCAKMSGVGEASWSVAISKEVRRLLCRGAEIGDENGVSANVDAERALLGCLLHDEQLVRSILIAEGLCPEDFQAPIHGVLARMLIECGERGTRLRDVTLGSLCDHRGAFEPVALLNVIVQLRADAPPVTTHADAYARLVKQKSELRVLLEKAKQVVSAKGGAAQPTAHGRVVEPTPLDGTAGRDPLFQLKITRELASVMSEAREIAHGVGQRLSTTHVLLAFFTATTSAGLDLAQRGINEDDVLSVARPTQREPANMVAALAVAAEEIASAANESVVSTRHVLSALQESAKFEASHLLRELLARGGK